VFPKELVVDLLTKKLKIYAVLVGIHRGNILWYNTKLLEKNGIKVGDQLSMANCSRSLRTGVE
jgi:ABC-type glycerol-3-phosphate transport system substrate-binding protein